MKLWFSRDSVAWSNVEAWRNKPKSNGTKYNTYCDHDAAGIPVTRLTKLAGIELQPGECIEVELTPLPAKRRGKARKGAK